MSGAASTPDLASIATNLGVFTLAIMATVAGIYNALKKIKAGQPGPTDASRLQAGVIVESTSMLMWSESNRDVVESNESVVRSNYAVRDEMKELRHQIERLRDGLDESKRWDRRQDT